MNETTTTDGEEGAEQPPPASGPAPEVNTTTEELTKHQIADFGEKIGGARKDTARPLGPRAAMSKPVDERPGWARRYHVGQDAKTGRWFVADTAKKGFGSGGHVIRGADNLATREEAEAKVPLIEVARNHQVSTDRDNPGQFVIYRKVGDRKMPTVKGGFASRDEAMKYMAAHPEEIIGHEFDFPAEVPHLEHVQRTGAERRKGPVSPADFQSVFGFRGGEFGNWNQGEHGQAVLNHAYDGLHDLADTLGLPPKAISLAGKLAVGFGSRGTGGLHSARAHYERDKAVINLTKIKGAGTFAHEWFHALDHHIGQVAGKTGGGREGSYASHGFPYKHTADAELASAFKGVMDTMTAKTVTRAIDESQADKQANFLRKHMADEMERIESRYRSGLEYGHRPKPFTPEQQARWDELKGKLLAGDFGGKVHVEGAATNRFGGYESFEHLQEMNGLFKKATGRSFISADQDSAGRRLASYRKSLDDTAKRVEQAKAGATEEKKRHTDYLAEAKKIDTHRTSDYWSTPHELAARAFEGYVLDKIYGGGHRSDYLVYGTKNHALNSGLGKPYPEGEERQAIHTAFDRLMEAVRKVGRLGADAQSGQVG